MNNFERIKNMSLDEMARKLTRIISDCCEYCPLQEDCKDENIHNCRESVKQWLQKECEE